MLIDLLKRGDLIASFKCPPYCQRTIQTLKFLFPKYLHIAFLLFALSMLLPSGVALAQQATSHDMKTIQVPAFRHIDPLAKNSNFKAFPIIRFAVSDNFPPFAYRNKNKVLTGFNILIASTICKVLRVECQFVVKPFNQAKQSVEDGLADVLITGLRQTTASSEKLGFTRPYFRFTARFAVRQSASIKKSDIRSLAGKRLGVATGTYHARFLKLYFSRSKLREFDNANDAFEALRTGAIDALFGDSVKMMFWLKGTASKNCCRFAGDAFLDPSSFSQPMSLAVKKGNHKLLDLMNHALDRLQVSGRYAKIYKQYFPLSIWKN